MKLLTDILQEIIILIQSINKYLQIHCELKGDISETSGERFIQILTSKEEIIIKESGWSTNYPSDLP